MPIYRIAITEDHAHKRVDKALADGLAEQQANISRVRIQSLIDEGQVFCGDLGVTSASRKTKLEEVYHVTVPEAAPAVPAAQNIELDILYEDHDLVVINKPAGMVVHPAPGNRDKTLVNALLAHCGDSLSGIGGVARPGIVHRLDKETSGLMVVAKNDRAHHGLAAQFADRTLSRTYRALVWGVPVSRQGQVDAPVGRHARDRKKMAVISKGKPALTYYRVLKDYGIAAMVECKLATGRTHQIRVHMAHLKHPLVGDPVYGRGTRVKGKLPQELLVFPRQALHAMALTFVHPCTGKKMSFKTKLPEDMQNLIADLVEDTPMTQPMFIDFSAEDDVD